MTQIVELQVRRNRLDDVRVASHAAPALADGQVLFAVDKFALTANNITYGVVGDMLGYWKFFPADGDYGKIPVWGFGVVIESRCAGINTGERF